MGRFVVSCKFQPKVSELEPSGEAEVACKLFEYSCLLISDKEKDVKKKLSKMKC